MQCEFQQQLSSEPQSLKEEHEEQRLLQVRSSGSLHLIIVTFLHFGFILPKLAFEPERLTRKQPTSLFVSLCLHWTMVLLWIFSLYCRSCMQSFDLYWKASLCGVSDPTAGGTTGENKGGDNPDEVWSSRKCRTGESF